MPKWQRQQVLQKPNQERKVDRLKPKEFRRLTKEQQNPPDGEWRYSEDGFWYFFEDRDRSGD
jgi:hypothetical protein